jgi:hypothetical protein
MNRPKIERCPACRAIPRYMVKCGMCKGTGVVKEFSYETIKENKKSN